DDLETPGDMGTPNAQSPNSVVKPRGANLRVWVFSALLAGGAGALLGWGPVAGLGPVRSLASQPVVAAVLIVAFAAVVLAPVSIPYRGQTYLFTLGEVPLLLGLVIAAPFVLVLSRMIGEAFAYGAVRRQPPVKL